MSNNHGQEAIFPYLFCLVYALKPIQVAQAQGKVMAAKLELPHQYGPSLIQKPQNTTTDVGRDSRVRVGWAC